MVLRQLVLLMTRGRQNNATRSGQMSADEDMLGEGYRVDRELPVHLLHGLGHAECLMCLAAQQPAVHVRCLRSASLVPILRRPSKAALPLHRPLAAASAMCPTETAPQPAASPDAARGLSSFQITATDGGARAGRLVTPHGAVQTPAALMYTRLGSAMFLGTDMLDKLRSHGAAMQLDVMHL